MSGTVPIAVIIPTYNRGMAVLSVLEKIHECDPKPTEIWVHIDLANSKLERELNQRFPKIGVLTSPVQLGPGGGRHRCLLACTTPYAVSFDDDSYPVDSDFFSSVERLFSKHSKAALFEATIWHRFESPKARTDSVIPISDYVGCGYALRLAAYRQVRGYLPRPVAYGMEESDLSLQLFVTEWRIFQAGELRVFHDTELKHHQSPKITSGVITNIGLYAFLHYPLIGLFLGAIQVINKIVYSIRMGRNRGIMTGVLMIASECYRHRQYRRPLQLKTLIRFLRFRRTGVYIGD